MSGLDFVALDVETANSHRGSICSFGLAVVEAGQVVRTEHWLTRPPEEIGWFDGFNMSLHGITPGDVAGQPGYARRLQQVLDVVGDRPVVAHNAAFDVGAVRDGCTADGLDWPTLTYGCSLVMARRALRLVSYRLPLVCDSLGIPLGHHHRADDDAVAAARIVLALAGREGAATLDDLAAALQVRLGRVQGQEWFGCVRPWGVVAGGCGAPPEANPDADPDHPLYGQVMVFTGALSVRREDAWVAVAQVGAVVAKGVTRNTNLLVVGDGFTGNRVEDFHTGKAAKAAAWNAKGQHIEVLTEGDLLDLLVDTRMSGTRQSDAGTAAGPVVRVAVRAATE